MHVACSWMYVLFYSSFVYISAYAYVFKSKVHGWSAVDWASKLPCTPPVHVPDVIGWLAVWRYTQNTHTKYNICTSHDIRWLRMRQVWGGGLDLVARCKATRQLVESQLRLARTESRRARHAG